MKSVKRIPQTCRGNLSWWHLLDHQKHKSLTQMSKQQDCKLFQSKEPFQSTNQDSPFRLRHIKVSRKRRQTNGRIHSHMLLKWSYFSSESRSSLPFVPPMMNALPWQATAPWPYRPVVRFAPLTHWSNFNWKYQYNIFPLVPFKLKFKMEFNYHRPMCSTKTKFNLNSSILVQNYVDLCNHFQMKYLERHNLPA